MAVNKLILAFITLILGVALLGSVATVTNDSTSLSKIVNESQTIVKNATDINTTYAYTLAQAPTGWKTDVSECSISSSAFTNSSGDAFTVTTDYVLDADAGTFTLKNTSNVLLTADNLTYVSYSYCPNDYINVSWGRTVINLIGGFFAITLLFVSLALFYSIGKETGIV